MTPPEPKDPSPTEAKQARADYFNKDGEGGAGGSASPAPGRPPYPTPVQPPITQVHSVTPFKPTQTVSFGDLESQERARRFTISAQPSAVNVTTQESLQSSQINLAANAPSLPPSRKASLTKSRKNSTAEMLSFMAPGNSSALANSLKQQNSSSTNVQHGYISSGASSRVNSPNLETSPHLPTSYSFEISKKTGRKVHKSPSPPPAGSQFPPAAGGSIQNTLERNPSVSGAQPQPIKINSPGANISRKNSTKKSNKTIVASPVGPPVPFQQYLTKEDDGKFHILLGCTGSVATIKVPLIIDKLFQIYGKSKVSIQLVVTKSAGHFLKGLKIHNDVKIWRDEDEWANFNEHAWNTSSTTTATTATVTPPLTSNNFSNVMSNLNPSAPVQKKPKNPYDKMILHNELRRWADIMLIAPLSANTLAKISNGIADNLLTSIIRSWGPTNTTTSQAVKKPILVAPAMNTFMYIHPITSKQISLLSQPEYGFGIEVLKPVEKVLICGDIGMGGMREWSDIVDILRRKINALKAERTKNAEALAEVEEDEDEAGDDGDEGDDEDDEEDDDDDDDDDDDEDDEDEDEDGENEDTHVDGNGGVKREHHIIDERDEDGALEEDSVPEINDNNDNDDMIFEITDQEGDDREPDAREHAGDGAQVTHITIPRETSNII